MDQRKNTSKNSMKKVVVVWGLAAAVAAFFIPSYDFGFDGIKVWIFICLLIFVVLMTGRFATRAFRSRSSNSQ